jgi:Mn-dependent DtxR family transcriptional regulator
VLFNCSAHIETEAGKKVAKGNVTEVGLINHLLRSNIKADEILAQKEAEGFVEF